MAIAGFCRQALLAKTGYTVTGGTNTDLVIGSEVANANWITGKKKVTDSAIMKAEEIAARHGFAFKVVLRKKSAER